MENTKNVENTIHAIITDGTHPLEVTSRTREIISIISSARVVYASLCEWNEKHWISKESLTDEAYNAIKPFFDYLDKCLVNSITENTMSLPFDGI